MNVNEHDRSLNEFFDSGCRKKFKFQDKMIDRFSIAQPFCKFTMNRDNQSMSLKWGKSFNKLRSTYDR